MTGSTVGAAGRIATIADARRRALRQRPGWLVPGADELFRSLYTGFDVTAGASFAVCSAISGEGKTTISLGLAIAIAQDLPDRRVVLAETDLWRPVLARDFGIPEAPGLVDCLLDRETVAAALRPTALDNLALLVGGAAVSSAQRLIRSARMPQLVQELRRTHDVVILDTPAALDHSEVALLARMVEDVIFVVRTGMTPVGDLSAAIARLQGAKVRGVLLNDTRSSVPMAVRRLVRM